MTDFSWNINNSSTDMIANIGSIGSKWRRSGNAFTFRRRPYLSRLAAEATDGWVDLGACVQVWSDFSHLQCINQCYCPSLASLQWTAIALRMSAFSELYCLQYVFFRKWPGYRYACPDKTVSLSFKRYGSRGVVIRRYAYCSNGFRFDSHLAYFCFVFFFTFFRLRCYV